MTSPRDEAAMKVRSGRAIDPSVRLRRGALFRPPRVIADEAVGGETTHEVDTDGRNVALGVGIVGES